MANRLNFYFKQVLTEADLDLAFDLMEKADRDLASDVGIFGIIDGMVATQHQPVANISIDLTGPGRAYDQLGRRIFYAPAQNVEVDVDSDDVSTDVLTSGNEKVVSVFVYHDRVESDPKTDGNSATINYHRDETHKFFVKQGTEAPAGTAEPPALEPDKVLIVDITRSFGQTQIVNLDLRPHPDIAILVGRRQDFVFAEARAVSVFTDGFQYIGPAEPHVQSVLENIDFQFDAHIADATIRHLTAHIDGAGVVGSPNSLSATTAHGQLTALLGFINSHESSATAHAAASLTYAAGPAWLGGRTNPATTVQAQLDKLIADLGGQTASDDGAERIGAAAVAGSPNSFTAGSVRDQLTTLLTVVNAHVNQAAGAHAGTAISYGGGSAWVDGVTNPAATVDAQLSKLVTDLIAQGTNADGAGRIGAEAVAGSPNALTVGSVGSQLAALLGHLNDHENAAAGAHAASAISYAAGPNWNDGGTNPATTVQAQVTKVITDLAADAAGNSGSERVGARNVVGSPFGLNAGSIYEQFSTVIANLNVYDLIEHNWMDTQYFQGPSNETEPTWSVDRVPSPRRLVFELLNGDLPLRMYYTVDMLEFTINADWSGSTWSKDNNARFAMRYQLARDTIRWQQRNSSVSGSWTDTEWRSADCRGFLLNFADITFNQTYNLKTGVTSTP